MCSRSSCSACTRTDGCGWCAPQSAAFGNCMSAADAESACSDLFTTESDRCPSVGADVMLKQITGMLGAIIAVAIILNVCNRVSNTRKKRKLKRSIFTLPVYVYTASSPSSSRGRADARRQALGQVALENENVCTTTSDTSRDIRSPRASFPPPAPSSGSCPCSEDGDNVSETTCSVCLAAYEEEEVIKVLPCGHEFHSGCLDSWLELKAMCPLCKAPAFTKSRSRDRGQGRARDWVARGRARIRGLTSAAATLPRLTGPASSDRPQTPPLDDSERTGGGVDAGLSLESAPPPETSAGVAAEVGADGSPPGNEPRPGERAVAGQLEEGAPSTDVVLEVEVEVAEAGGLEDGRAPEETVTASSGGNGRMLAREPAGAPLESAAVSTSSPVAAAARTTGVDGTAGEGSGSGRTGSTHPSGPSPPCHGASATGDGREGVSLSELEGGQARPGKANSIVAGVTAEDGLDVGPAEVTAGGLDIENGGNVVDGAVNLIYSE